MLNIFIGKQVKINILDPKTLKVRQQIKINDPVQFDHKKTAGDEEFILDIGDFIEKTDTTVIDRDTDKTVTANFYTEDTIADFKVKVYKITGILPCEQHYIGPIRGYDISVNGIKYMPKFTIGGEDIDGIPIYRQLYNSRDEISITNYEYMQVYRFLEAQNYEIEMISLSDVTENLTNWDDQSFSIIYWSMVQFFPYFNSDAFKSYLSNTLSTSYPLLADPNIDIDNSDKINGEIYDFLAKADDLYNPQFLENKKNDKSMIFVDIKKISVISYKTSKINIHSLLNELKLSAEEPIIRYISDNVANTYVLSKDKYGLSQYNMYKYMFSDTNNTLSILHKNCVVEVNAIGLITVHAKFASRTGSNFKIVRKLLETIDKDIVSRIVSMGHKIFNGTDIKSVYIVKNIEATINILRSFGNDQYRDMINSLMDSGFISNEGDKYFWTKNNYKYSRTYTDVWNDYAYYFDASYIEQYNEWFKGRPFQIIRKSTDILFNLQNFRVEEFQSFYKFLITIISQIESGENELGSMKDIILGKTKSNNLKLLKFNDPNTFDLNQYGSDVIYARLCQKSRQPIPINNEKDLQYVKNMERVMKYKNHSTGNDIWYYCPHDMYKYPNFIVGFHPKNYCMACCNKNSSREGSKKELVINTCVSEHKYDISNKKVKSTRYINQYGKDIEVNRLSSLPNNIVKFIIYNVQNMELLSEYRTERIFIMNGKTYSIDKLFKITKRSKIFSLKTSSLDMILHIPIWSSKRGGPPVIKPIEVINEPRKNRKFRRHYERIVNADLSYPILLYSDRKGVIVVDGIHRICKAYVNEIKTINAKKVTLKQLERAKIAVSPDQDAQKHLHYITAKSGGAVIDQNTYERRPFYYILGVEQNIGNVNIGMVSCMASIFGMTLSTYIEYLCNEIEATKLSVDNYTYMDLIHLIQSQFGPDPQLDLDVDWNDIIYNISIHLHSVIPIILEDVNTIKPGSNKSEDDNGILLHLPYKIRSLEEFGSNMRFALIFMKKTQEGDIYYYPIFIFIPYVYFKRSEIEMRLFDYDNIFIKLMDQIIKNHFDVDNMNFDKISNFAGVNNINKIFLDEGNSCYACELTYKGKKVYVGFDNVYISSDFKRAKKLDNSDYSLRHFDKFMHDFNTFYKNENQFVSKIVFYKDKIIAVRINNNIHFVCGKIGDFENLKIEESAVYETLLYDPADTIKAILDKDRDDPLKKKFLDIQSKGMEYFNFKQDIFDILYAERNKSERQRLKKMFDENAIDAKSYVYKNYVDASNIVSDIPDLDQIYSFDKMTLSRLKGASKAEISKIIHELAKSLKSKKYDIKTFTEALIIEFSDPVKNELLYEFNYKFSKPPRQIQPDEDVYVKSLFK